MARRLEALPEIANIDLDKRLFNEVYFPHLLTIHNYEIYYGGSGSGKSTFVGGQKLPLQLTLFGGRNLVCLRQQKSDCVTSCWGEIYNGLKKLRLLDYWIIKENPVHKMVNRINGNEILFEGLDNIEDIKSIKFTNKGDGAGDANVTDIWYEEVNAERHKEVIEELDRRLRDPQIKCRLLLSFNPVSRTHWLYDYVMHEIQVKGIDSLVLKTTYKDNHFLPKDYGEKLERFRMTNPYAYQVYALGNWGTMGQSVFDPNKIQARLSYLESYFLDNPYIEGQFDYTADDKGIPVPNTLQFFETRKGAIHIFQKPDPKKPYVVSLDPSGGSGGDYHVAYVLDNVTKEQVAMYRYNGSPDAYIWQVYGLCKMYNDALFAPEINFNMWPVKAFTMLKYSNIYQREKTADNKRKGKELKYGFRTGPNNRQTMLTEMVQWTNANMDKIFDVELLNEMLLFTVQEKKMEGIFWGAEPGAHDDCVMSYAILLQALSQQHNSIQPERTPLEGEWLRVELESAVDSGRVDRRSALEYIKRNGVAFESNEKKYLAKIKSGGSRYARR